MQTLLHLFLVVLLPITTALSSRGVESRRLVVIYGTHLALLDFVNLRLWIQLRKVAHRGRIVGSALTLASLNAASAIGMVRPGAAQYFWYAAFALPWFGRRLERRISKAR